MAKDSNPSTYFVLMGEGRAGRQERSPSRRSRPVQSAIISCGFRDFGGQGASAVTVSADDPNIPDGSVQGKPCGEAIATFLAHGYRIVDVDTGHFLGPLDFTLLKE